MEIVGTAVGLLGVFLAVYFYYRTRRFKRLAYSVRTFGFVSDRVSAIEGLNIQYNNRPVSNLTAAKILVRNMGKEVINATDVAQTDLLRVVAPEGAEILKIGVLAESTKANQIKVQKMTNTVAQIDIEYMAPGDGCVFFVLHSGSEKHALRLHGTVKGGSIVQGAETDYSGYVKPLRWLVPVLIMPMLVMMILTWVQDDFSVRSILEHTTGRWALIAYQIVIMVFMLAQVILTMRTVEVEPLIERFRKELAPEDFA